MEIFIKDNMWLVIIAIVWVLPWKGYALWTASRASSKRWFIVLLVINTFAILDILYVFYIAKKTPKDIIRVFKSKI